MPSNDTDTDIQRGGSAGDAHRSAEQGANSAFHEELAQDFPMPSAQDRASSQENSGPAMSDGRGLPRATQEEIIFDNPQFWSEQLGTKGGARGDKDSPNGPKADASAVNDPTADKFGANSLEGDDHQRAQKAGFIYEPDDSNDSSARDSVQGRDKGQENNRSPQKELSEQGDTSKAPGDRATERQLPTGDTIEKRADGTQILTTPNGDKITVNPDGSHSVEGNVKAIQQKGELTSVTFADGAKVTMDKQGILTVQRGDEAVAFSRLKDRDRKPEIQRPKPPRA